MGPEIMDIEYTQEALDDFDRLWQFLMDASAPYADEMTSDIIRGLQNLQLFPRIGLPVSRARDPDVMRDWYIGKYCVRYLIGKNTIYVLRIWHGKEDERNRIP